MLTWGACWTGADHEVVPEGGKEIATEEEGGEKAEVVEAQEQGVIATAAAKPADASHPASAAAPTKDAAVKQTCACCTVQ